MTDLTEALREAGHGDIADALEKKALAGQLRKAGRDDLADALEAGGEPEPEPEQPQPRHLGEVLLDGITKAQNPWYTDGGNAPDEAGGRDAA